MVEDKEFRQDLLYRINTVEMKLPSLQQRLDDIPLLVEHFSIIYRKKYHKENLTIKPAVLEKLKTHSWAGNIRELQHATERAIILSEGNSIDSIDQFVSRTVKAVDHSEPRTMDEMERDFILSSLDQNQGNVTKTAEVLGLTRTAMYRRMKKHGIYSSN
jgi:DNA-binding NtrC family response regulator